MFGHSRGAPRVRTTRRVISAVAVPRHSATRSAIKLCKTRNSALNAARSSPSLARAATNAGRSTQIAAATRPESSSTSGSAPLAAQEPFAELVRDGVVELPRVQPVPHVDHPAWSVATEQSIARHLATWHREQVAFAEDCCGDSRRAWRLRRIEADADVELASEDVADFVPGRIHVQAPRQTPRNAESLTSIPALSKSKPKPPVRGVTPREYRVYFRFRALTRERARALVWPASTSLMARCVSSFDPGIARDLLRIIFIHQSTPGSPSYLREELSACVMRVSGTPSK